MSFCGQMMKELAGAVGQLADQTKKMTEIVRLKSQVSVCEKIVEKNYMELGKRYYSDPNSPAQGGDGGVSESAGTIFKNLLMLAEAQRTPPSPP